MEKVRLNDKTFRLYLPYEKISAAIDEVADRLNRDFRDCEDVPILLCVLNGAIVFTGELLQRLDFPLNLVSIKMTSYAGTSTTGEVKEAMGLTADVRGRRVIVVEDIVDTGYTMVALRDILMARGAADFKVCTLLHKPDALKADIRLDYVGLNIPNDFIVGFGLDYDELGRNLKDIYVLDK